MKSSIFVQDASSQVGISDFHEAMETFGLNFEVDKKDLFTHGETNPVGFSKGMVRTDTGACLGIVSPKYPVISPMDKFKALKEFADDGILEFVDGGTFGNNQAKIHITARVKGTININADKGDIIEKRVIFYSSYDGSKSNEFAITPYRLVCTNGMAIPETEYSIRFKNTKNSGLVLDNIAVRLEEALNQYRNVEEFFKTCINTPVNAEQEMDFVNRVLQIASEDISTKKDNQRNELLETISSGTGQEEIEEMNLYKLINGVTCWTNHNLAGKKDDPTDFIYFGTGNAYNQRAWVVAREMAMA